MVNIQAWQLLAEELRPKQVTLVAVSKTKPVSDILALYELGQRDFGENYVQELVEKQTALPADIRWHFIGHLQTNKVKYIAPFVHLIHGIDSFRLLEEVNKQGAKLGRTIDVLLQRHIATEETKHGLSETDLWEFMDYYDAQKNDLVHVRIRGMMGMASLTADADQISEEFSTLRASFDSLRSTRFFAQHYFDTLSMGMSSDYKLALSAGSSLVRIGSTLFGSRA